MPVPIPLVEDGVIASAPPVNWLKAFDPQQANEFFQDVRNESSPLTIEIEFHPLDQNREYYR